METARGALVSDVAAGSPAERAGIRARDVIVDYGEKPIKESSNLPLMVVRTPVGSRINITVLRDKKGGSINGHDRRAQGRRSDGCRARGIKGLGIDSPDCNARNSADFGAQARTRSHGRRTRKPGR